MTATSSDGQPPVTAFVPMRHFSRRVPGKNYRPLGGRPLYHHVVENLLSCPAVREVVIDTDSDLILEDAASSFPERVRLIRRAEHLLGEFASIHEILLHDAIAAGADVCLQTHSTNPFVSPETVGRAIAAYLESRPEHDSLFTVTPRQVRFYWPDGRPVNHDPENLLRTQDLPPIYEENSCMYIVDRATLERRRNRLGDRPLMFPVAGEEASDIDDEEDWDLVEALYEARRRRGHQPV
jgi:CMP-N-acetylneuraminic acid synthetase